MSTKKNQAKTQAKMSYGALRQTDALFKAWAEKKTRPAPVPGKTSIDSLRVLDQMFRDWQETNGILNPAAPQTYGEPPFKPSTGSQGVLESHAVTDRDLRPGPVKEGNIDAVIKDLAVQIDRLCTAVGEMETRLSSVMAPGTAIAKDGGMQPPALCPLAEILQTFAGKVRSCTDQLQEIRSRVEL